MVLGTVLPYLTSCGNGAMWARFVGQTVDRSTICLRNDNISQVVLHQVALIGLNFCFLDHLGYISLTSPLVGGLCLTPIFWAVACFGSAFVETVEDIELVERIDSFRSQIHEAIKGEPLPKSGLKSEDLGLLETSRIAFKSSIVRARLGLESILRLNVYASIAAAALFASSGYLVFAAVFGGLLVSAQMRRSYSLPLKMAWCQEGVEFLTSNIAAVVIGTWYHRLRAVADVGIRLRDYYKLRIKTEPILPKVKTYTDLKTDQVGPLMSLTERGKLLLPTSEHIDWAGIELPDERPEGVDLNDYQLLASRVCTLENCKAMRSGLKAYDDHFKSGKYTDVEVVNYVGQKVGAWIQAVERGNSEFSDQTERTQRYALWIYHEIKESGPFTQANTIAKLTGSIRPNIDVCSEHTIDIAEQVYLSLARPNENALNQIVSYLLQGLRRHILHQFLERLKTRFPNWMLDPEERHLLNQLISILNQRGMHLGIPEEKTASTDRYYSGSFVEALLWYETREFERFFRERYTPGEILSAIKNTDWEWKFKEYVNDWTAPPERRGEDLSQSITIDTRPAYDGADLKDGYRYGLLVRLGVLTPSKNTFDKLQGNLDAM